MTIYDVLEKIGLQRIDQLNEVERQTFKQWERILNRPDVTVEDIKAFAKAELDRADQMLHNYDNDFKKEFFFKALATLAERLHTFITTSDKERENLKAFLRNKYKIE